MRLAPNARPSIIAELRPHLPRLILHREASGILDEAFQEWCSNKERTALMRAWWGKEADLFFTE